MREEDPWIPETPMKQTAPIGSNTVEEEAHGKHLGKRRFVGNKDTESLCFSGQIPERTGDTESRRSVAEDEHIIKTPKTKKKHRPKVLKPKKKIHEEEASTNAVRRAPKPRTPKKPVVADSQESKPPMIRTYVRRKKVEDQSTPAAVGDRELLMRKKNESVESPSDNVDEVVADSEESKPPIRTLRTYVRRKKVDSSAVDTSTHARRPLHFELEHGENRSNPDTEQAGQTAVFQKLLVSQESKGWLLPVPKRKRSRHVDVSITQTAKRRRQVEKPTCKPQQKDKKIVVDTRVTVRKKKRITKCVKSQTNQIVVFGGGTGEIVPSTPVKKRRPLPKVDLDDETERVWKLLLEDINSDGTDGAKYWEEERKVFRGRAEAFIARMHLVQGDRRFTPWKGSVVDSVVGVFLTQSVSDHLSSSAFMSLAAHFPVTSVPSSNFDVGTSSTSIQITHLDSEESMSSPPDQSSEISLEGEYHTSYLKLLRGLQGSQEDSNQKSQSDNSRQEVGVSSSVKEKKKSFDWDILRRETEDRTAKREKTATSMDTVDWEAVRRADVNEVAEVIKKRGLHHLLAERIQSFLDRLVKDHGSIDLEWLRDVQPDKGKEYLMSINGLGLKSTECVRLLTLHQLAFPVDTNVGRIAVRLGWVPLQPLPESLQLHLLEMYPVLDSVQKYLWPRLCKFDIKTLYELHYQMITFGKVFCTKTKPNCNACPMRGECKHFASAFASARLALPGTEKGMGTPDKNPMPLYLPEPLHSEQGSKVLNSETANSLKFCEPIIDEPASPEQVSADIEADIEDAFFEDPEEIPTIRLNTDAFTISLKKIMEDIKEVGNMSTALVALTDEAASLPMPKLKNISRLRTEHQVYELPDTHPLLAELEKREPDDPCSYLLAIWTPGETADSIKPAVSKCISQANGKLCDEENCFSCKSIKEAQSQTVRGTILIPCRTAMRGSFPLNGTYFQVNEVFADHASSLKPIDVPRDLIWDLPRKTVYFGTSTTSIFKGLSTYEIQQCFWRGFVCVRGFDRRTRGPKPLIARLHFPGSKLKTQA
ncbi:PREDICTED: protein ROS1-like [Camelina sativa]|uniref:Protein ROS1-like n=1 Tax=Camelina sativa TaxID=90675 RepID=A0ABM1RNJ7_CAMSA|nr:PREDICTED: protein ROS1-like [Camelina sativa]XP_010506093.1 PREDICTED: protein ROS1-like [Camelina sativa]XP_019100585.1 PREDICTED: protein ROS1-like [Camelina sativa]